MAIKKSVLLLALSALSPSVDAFSVRCHSSTSSLIGGAALMCPSPSKTTSCLFAEESNNNGTEEESSAPTEEATPSGEAAPVPSAETDILSSPAFLKRKLEVLKSDIAATEAEIAEVRERAEAGKAEWGPQLDDLRKEYKNIQERMASQSELKDMEVTRSVVREMLDFLDNFDRAFGAVKPETDEQKAIEAEYKEAYQTVMDVITSLGVEEVATVGIEFDYELHQAVMQKPSDEYEEGIVCEEFAKGFKIGDTLIRAAMVAVAV